MWNLKPQASKDNKKAADPQMQRTNEWSPVRRGNGGVGARQGSGIKSYEVLGIK